MEALGAKITTEYGKLIAEAPNGLTGADIYLDTVSVGATVNIMLAAVKAQGVTTIVNAAKEPHVVDMANFLNCVGAKITGAGTDVIKVRGVKSLKGAKLQHHTRPDRNGNTDAGGAPQPRGDVNREKRDPHAYGSINSQAY